MHGQIVSWSAFSNGKKIRGELLASVNVCRLQYPWAFIGYLRWSPASGERTLLRRPSIVVSRPGTLPTHGNASPTSFPVCGS